MRRGVWGGERGMWKRQANLAKGNTFSCCRKFLNKVIPYLVEVLIQDGIYLIRDFPNHTMLNHLKVQTRITYTRTAVRSKNALLALL